MDGGFSADAASIDGSAHLLVEIAGLLHAGRLDADIGTMARVPRSHPEVGARVQEFARFAVDQYQDLVLLLTALATRLKATGSDYVRVDQRVQAELNKILLLGRFVHAEDR